MASWTETRPPTFAPYIQQQPVEQMVAVGMEKQRRYDEGVRRIQANVDRVAGLDIMRDVDRNYLESELNQLGRDLQTVAAGDFSNYQLVSSVSGMASRIAKDPAIMNSVKSTAWYRKQVEQMQKDSEEGNYNPANVKHFSKRAENWLNSTTPGESFGESYVTPIDIWGKINDIADEVGIDSQLVQEMLQTDGEGNYITDEDGKPMWNHVMVEETLKGKDAGKILRAFETALTPADYQQLAIEGEYHYGNYTPAMLEQEIRTNAAGRINDTDKKISKLKTELYKEKNSNEEDVDKTKSLEEQIKYFEKLSQKFKRSLEDNVDEMYDNPDKVKRSLYTDDYLYTMANVLSSQESSTKYLSNPMFNAMMRLSEFDRQLAEDNRRQERWDFEMKQKYGKTLGGVAGIKMPVADDEAIKLKREYEKAYTDEENALKDKQHQIALEALKNIDVNERLLNESISEYDRRMREKLFRESNGDLEGYVTEIAAKQLDDWHKGEDVPVEWIDTLEEMEYMMDDLEFRKGEMEDIKQEARLKAMSEGLNVPSDEELKEILSPTIVDLMDNPYGVTGSVSLSRQDMLDFANLHPSQRRMFGFLSVSDEEREKADEAEERLRNKYPDIFDALEHELYGRSFVPYEGSGKLYNVHPAIQEIIDITTSADYKQYQKIEADMYRERGMLQNPVAVPILKGKENIQDFKNVISTVIESKRGGKDKIKPKDLHNAIASEDMNAVMVISQPGQSAYSPTTHILRVISGGEDYDLEISVDDYETLVGSKPPVGRQRPVIMEKLDKYKTTNRLGTKDPRGAYFGRDKFVNFESDEYDITGDLVESLSGSGLVWLMLYLRRKDTDDYEILHYPDRKTTDERLRKYKDDGSYNFDIMRAPMGVNNEVIRQLDRKKQRVDESGR